MKTTIAVLGGLFVSLFGGSVYVAKNNTVTAPVTAPVTAKGMRCPALMKVCPDGSNAIRATSSCNFLPCTETPVTTKPTLTVHLNESITVNGVTLTPLSIISDSRCPANARCIQAGEIKVNTRIVTDGGKEETVLTLGVAHTFMGKNIMLDHASQSLKSGTVMLPSEYTFGFSVTSTDAPIVGELVGSISIGPVCPVQRVDGAGCVPSPETYASYKIYIQSTTNKRPALTLTPNAQGKFYASLPVGTYVVDIDHPQAKIERVTGAPQTIVIKKGEVVSVSISIDTGMRTPSQLNN